ncbi:ribosomal protein S12 methylthiotransferase accessory factor [Actinoplanes derwentensis]|uniref:Ribosomal protein S12 methylthiotransferase accessory factor n=2 Tax=Actinoplanes derwentensis TaxID=113562 RepID=A0A1H1RZ34_9ACTN|nr:ribosomal protein S12 methylthiotransferase accessory factor [Actinoplanes derwentensis]
MLSTPVRKRFWDGTHRTCPPAQTLEWVRPHLAAMGITRIADVTGLDRIGVPVVTVCRPNSRSLTVSQGKGIDLDSATASGVLESIELHHAERVMLPLLLASQAELGPTREVVEVAGLPRVTDSRFHPHLPLLWVEGYDILTSTVRWVPFEVVHISAVVPPPAGSGCFAATSNGLASGNHLLEALVHALLEVVERDATAVWGARGEEHRIRTAVDPATIDHPVSRSVLNACATAGVQVAVFDTTSDTGIPSFLCEVREHQFDPQGRGVFTGLGCHLNRGVALSRALTEALQSRLTLITGSRDDLSRSDYVLGPDAPTSEIRPWRSFRAVPDLPELPTFNEDLALILRRLESVGIRQVIGVDLTRPEFGIPVVRVVVPGLEGPDDDPAYVPGPRARNAKAGPR